jgi:hypothetical protein
MSRRKPGKAGYWTKRSKNLGRRERVFDEDEAFILLKAAIEREGSLIAFAEQLWCQSHLCQSRFAGQIPYSRRYHKSSWTS